MQSRLRLEEGWSTLILLVAMLGISSLAVMQADWINGLQLIPMASTAASANRACIGQKSVSFSHRPLIRLCLWPVYNPVPRWHSFARRFIVA